jgi:hypothetical protein
VLGASREEGHPSRSTPLRSGRGQVLHSQASAHVARHEVVSSRSATRLNNAEPGGAGRKSGGLRRRTQRPGESRRLRPVARADGLERAGAASKRATLKEVIRRTARCAPDGGADRRGSPGWVSRKGTTARRAPDDGPARGEEQSSTNRVVPARQCFKVADFGFENLMLAAQRKRSDGLARGGQPGRRRKTRTGSCSERRGAKGRRKASRIVASRPFHE